MFTLKQVIKLLGLSDSDMVYICKEHCQPFAPYLTIKQIRNKYDMKNTIVKRVYPYHHLYHSDFEWELIIV